MHGLSRELLSTRTNWAASCPGGAVGPAGTECAGAACSAAAAGVTAVQQEPSSLLQE